MKLASSNLRTGYGYHLRRSRLIWCLISNSEASSESASRGEFGQQKTMEESFLHVLINTTNYSSSLGCRDNETL